MKCTKIPYSSRNQATRVPSRYGNPHYCRSCGAWHVGHKMSRKRKAEISAERWRDGYEPIIKLVQTICGA